MHFELFLNSYPDKAPVIKMLDTVVHPNVQFEDTNGKDESDVCLNILDDWDDAGQYISLYLF